MGANNVLIHSDKNWEAEVKDITAKKGVDIVFEHIGKKTWKQSLSVLAKGGRIVTCGATAGQNVSINLAHLFIKQHSILGSTMSSLPIFNEVMKCKLTRNYVVYFGIIFLV